jgi:hypothetical protein
MKKLIFHLIRVLFLRKGRFIHFYYNQKSKNFVNQAYYKELFSKNHKQLLYLGTLHTHDPDAECINNIYRDLKEFKPDCIVYEQYIRPQSWVDTREERIRTVLAMDYIDEYYVNKIIKTYGESGYADYQGRYNRGKGVTYMFEPSGEAIFDHLLKYHKKEEVFLYHCLMFLDANKQRIIEKSDTIKEFFERHAVDYDSLVSTKTDIAITLENFYYYHIKILNKPFDDFSTALWQFTNISKRSLYITQKVAKSEMYFRDTKVVEGIYDLTKKYDKIAVVYGNIHYHSQRHVIKQMYRWLV